MRHLQLIHAHLCPVRARKAGGERDDQADNPPQSATTVQTLIAAGQAGQ